MTPEPIAAIRFAHTLCLWGGGLWQTVNDGVDLQLVAANAEAVSRAAAAEAAALSAGVALSAHVSTAIDGITRSVAGDVSGLTASLANSTAATTRTVAGVTTALAGKADNIKKLWSGGCSQYPGGGWNWYCLDRELYNTAAGYFVKADNTRFRALRANMMINFVVWTITHVSTTRTARHAPCLRRLRDTSCTGVPPRSVPRDRIFTATLLLLFSRRSAVVLQGSGWNIVNMYLDGTQLMYSYSHTAGCWWRDMQGNMLFKVNVGQHWRVRMCVLPTCWPFLKRLPRAPRRSVAATLARPATC